MIERTLTTLLLAQDPAPGDGISWLETIQKGGAIGSIIIGLSVIALALIVMHVIQIRRPALLPAHHLETLDELLSRHDVNAALEYCLSPDNDSYLTRILSAGLTRYQKSAFGAFEVKNAIEEAGEDQTARLYRSTDALGVIGAIAPLLGLLGTVLGMVGAFEVLETARSDPGALASQISLALVTTLLGLVLAIPCVALFTFFRNRIDSLASEAGMEIERLVLYLESAAPASTAATGGAARRPPIGGPPRRVPPAAPPPGPGAGPGPPARTGKAGA